jgi:hypothetical protein
MDFPAGPEETPGLSELLYPPLVYLQLVKTNSCATGTSQYSSLALFSESPIRA